MTDKPTPTTDLHDTLQMAEHETLTEALALLAKWSQPAQAQAGAVPLTPERVKEIVRGAGYDQCGIPDTERAAFINGLRHGEQEHGIKGGQHGAK